MGALFADLDVDGDMMRLARAFARRNAISVLGIVQARGLVGALPVAQFRDERGALLERTLEELRASVPASAPKERAPQGPVDTRTLALF